MRFGSRFCGSKTKREGVHPLMESLNMSYLRTADGAPVAGKWVNFRELPEGKCITKPSRLCSDMLSKHWGNNIQGFITTCKTLVDSLWITVMPALPCHSYLEFRCTNCWVGDEEFPSRASILFDANAHHYMITGGLAVWEVSWLRGYCYEMHLCRRKTLRRVK